LQNGENVLGEVARTCSNWSKAYFTPFHAIAVNREQKIISTLVHASLQARVWRALAAVTATATVVNAGQELRCAAAFGVRVRRAEAKTLRRGKERHQADATAKHDNDARQLERGGDGRAQRTHDAPHERRAAFIRIARIHILLFYGLYFFFY
jgi:hypothetical protein